MLKKIVTGIRNLQEDEKAVTVFGVVFCLVAFSIGIKELFDSVAAGCLTFGVTGFALLIFTLVLAGEE